VDEDSQEVVRGLEHALAVSGLSQADFAASLGTSASRFSAYRAGRTVPSAAFYLRALRLAAALKSARDHGWMTPVSTAREIRDALREDDDVWALKIALQGRDHLRELLRTADATSDAWTASPRTTGDRRWDALLGALTRHEFMTVGHQAPIWTTRPARYLNRDDEWVLPSLLLDEPEVRATTPNWLAEHGIYAAERDLVTA
jgi:transcriptional regulator with XRE-family HTH domain